MSRKRPPPPSPRLETACLILILTLTLPKAKDQRSKVFQGDPNIGCNSCQHVQRWSDDVSRYVQYVNYDTSILYPRNTACRHRCVSAPKAFRLEEKCREVTANTFPGVFFTTEHRGHRALSSHLNALQPWRPFRLPHEVRVDVVRSFARSWNLQGDLVFLGDVN